MIIYLYGPDSYRRQEKLKEVIAEYKQKHPNFSIQKFYLENAEDFDKLRNFVNARSLFDSVQLGIIFNGTSLKEKDKKDYIALLKENLNNKQPALAIVDEKAPLKDFKFLLEKPVYVYESFEALNGEDFKLFLQKESQKRGLDINQECQTILTQAYLNDSWGLITELDTLTLLDNKKINKQSLEGRLYSLPINLSSFINQMKNSRKIEERLYFLEELFTRGKDSAMIFNMMAYSPYADYKWKETMADYDVSIKSGKLEYEEILLELALSQ